MRTEEQVFNDFKNLGYKAEKPRDNLICLESKEVNIYIDFRDNTYEKTDGYENISISMEEHRLLHELFKIWGWLE